MKSTLASNVRTKSAASKSGSMGQFKKRSKENVSNGVTAWPAPAQSDDKLSAFPYL